LFQLLAQPVKNPLGILQTPRLLQFRDRKLLQIRRQAICLFP
jgi:hypothetical protein